MSDEFIRQSFVVVGESSVDSFVLQRGRTVHKKGDLGRLTPTRRVQFAVPGDDSGRKGGNPKRGIEHNPVVNLRRKKLVSWVQNHYNINSKFTFTRNINTYMTPNL